MQRHKKNQIGVLVDYKLMSNYKIVRLIYWQGTDYYGVSTKAEE